MRISLLATTAALSLTGCLSDATGAHDDDATEWDQAYQELASGKVDSCSGVGVADRGPFGKTVFLTFDDGPNPATTPEIVALLRERNIPATFFMNGSRMGDGATVAASLAADAQFILANHSTNHKNMSRLGAATVAREIEATDTALRDLGVAPKYFRFPFGASTCDTMAAVHERGYQSVGWHVDSADWCFASGGGYCKASTFRWVDDRFRGDMAGYIMSQLRRTQGGVVLFHDIHRNTADELAAILDRLVDDGYTFGRLDDARLLPETNR